MLLKSLYKSLIKPLRDNKINELLNLAPLDIYSPYDKKFSLSERFDPIKELRNTLVTWSQPAIAGLDTFPYTYVANGNTEWLNHLFASNSGTIAWKKGDYSYYKLCATSFDKEFTELENPQEIDDLILSWPGYAYGDSTELDFAKRCKSARLHLDVAYLGTTSPIQTDVSEFETVAITLSKTLAIPYNRISMVFSKHSIPTYDIMNSIGYVNLSGVNIANYLLKHIDIGYFWNTYNSLYQNICDKLELTPTQCILTAYAKTQRISTASFLMDAIKQ
jgi:hypothetical protein